MRSFEDIVADIIVGMTSPNHERLRHLAIEIEQYRTKESQAWQHAARGAACSTNADYSTAIDHFENALTFFESSSASSVLANVHLHLGSAYSWRHNYVLSSQHLQRALSIFTTLNDEIGVLKVYGVLSGQHVNQEDYPEAKRCLFQALEIAQRSQPRHLEAGLLGNLGAIYFMEGECEKSFEYNRRFLDLSVSLNNERGRANALNQLGMTYERIGSYVESMEHLIAALAIAEKADNHRSAALINLNIGLVYIKLGDITPAFEYLTKGHASFEGMQDTVNLITAKVNLARVLGLMEQYDEALRYANNALELARSVSDSYRTAHSLFEIARVLEMQGNSDEALAILSEISEMDFLVSSLHVDIKVLHAQILAKKQEHGKAKDIVVSGLEYARKHGDTPSLIEVYKTLRTIAQETGDMAQYVESNNEFLRYSNELVGTQTKVRIAILMKERELNELRELNEQQRANAESLQAESALQQRVLSDYAAQIVKQNNWIDDVRTRIRRIIRQANDAEAALSEIRDSLSDFPKQNLNWQRFHEEFIHFHPEYEQQLRTSIPDLTTTEMKVCCLLLLTMSTHDIAALLCVSERTIDIHRSNIRKKLGLRRQESLHTALSRIASSE